MFLVSVVIQKTVPEFYYLVPNIVITVTAKSKLHVVTSNLTFC